MTGLTMVYVLVLSFDANVTYSTIVNKKRVSENDCLPVGIQVGGILKPRKLVSQHLPFLPSNL